MFFPYCQLHYGHIQIDLVNRFKKIDYCLEILWSVVGFFVVLFLLYWMILGLTESKNDNSISKVLEWSEWYFYIPGIVSLALWAIVLFFQSITKIFIWARVN